MIEATNLTMRFGGRTVVDGVSFDVAPGTVVGFLGPNGAGKSTTMRMLTGFLAPAAGSARICGHDMARDRRAGQACIGYLPEATGGFHNLTVREFLTYCGAARGLTGARLREAIDRSAGRIDLAPALDAGMKTLSKGWRQRAWLAQALIHDPPVLVLDEPTDGLDPIQKRQVRRLIREVAADKAILLSTHILEEAEAVCGRAIVIAEGRILADDETGNLSGPDGRLTAAFHGLVDQAAGRPGPPA